MSVKNSTSDYPLENQGMNQNDSMYPDMVEDTAGEDLASSSNGQADLQSSTESVEARVEADLEIRELKQELEDWKAKAYRYAADLQNLGKQHELDTQQSRKSGKKQVTLSILSFINTLNLAFAFAPNSEDPQVSKFVATLRQSFDQVLRELSQVGVEVLIPNSGDLFDPAYMSILNGETLQGEQTRVSQVVSLAVRIDCQLVQPASVLVAATYETETEMQADDLGDTELTDENLEV